MRSSRVQDLVLLVQTLALAKVRRDGYNDTDRACDAVEHTMMLKDADLKRGMKMHGAELLQVLAHDIVNWRFDLSKGKPIWIISY